MVRGAWGPVEASVGLGGPEWVRSSEMGQEMVRKGQRGPDWVRGGRQIEVMGGWAWGPAGA